MQSTLGTSDANSGESPTGAQEPNNQVPDNVTLSDSDLDEDHPEEPPKKRVKSSGSVCEDVSPSGVAAAGVFFFEPAPGPSGVLKNKSIRRSPVDRPSVCSCSSSSDKEELSDDSSGSSDPSSAASNKSTPSNSAESTTDNNKSGSSLSKQHALKQNVRLYSVTDMLKKTCEQLLQLLKRRREKENLPAS